MYVLGIPCASHVMIAELVEEAGGEIFTDTSGGTVKYTHVQIKSFYVIS